MTLHQSLSIASDATAFVMQGQTLAKALSAIKFGITGRTNIPILETVRLTGNAEGLSLTACDIDAEYSYKIALDGLPSFDICTPYKPLLKLAKAKAKAAILIETGEGLSLDGLSLDTRKASDFPSVKPANDYAALAMNGAQFKPLLHAISTEETRYYLNGILVRAEAGKASFVSTDGHRLAHVETGIDWPEGQFEDGAIIPANFAKFIAAQGEGELSIGRNTVIFKTANMVAISKTIDGSFPDYRRVIPTQNDVSAMVQKDLLADGLKMLRALCTEKKCPVRFTFEGQAVNLSYNGKSHAIESAPHDGNGLDIGFNADYILDLCANHPGDTLTLEFRDYCSPVRIRCGNLTFVLMPMRV